MACVGGFIYKKILVMIIIMENMKIKVLVATHKTFQMPKDEMYVPLHVGREGKADLGYIGDNTGDNISLKNSSWSELTGLYWGWKNLDCDYMGLVQYRRHFMFKRKREGTFDSILTKNEAVQLLNKADIILPQKRNYRIMTLEEHFNGYDFSVVSDLTSLRKVIHSISPEYDKAVDAVMARKSGHMCNMFIMKKNLLNDFCEWEFSILNALEKMIGNDRKRIIGYIAEHMLDIWIEKNEHQYVECNVALLDRKNEFDRRFDFLMRILGLKSRRIPLD